jgi:hypothetical protein
VSTARIATTGHQRNKGLWSAYPRDEVALGEARQHQVAGDDQGAADQHGRAEQSPEVPSQSLDRDRIEPQDNTAGWKAFLILTASMHTPKERRK